MKGEVGASVVEGGESLVGGSMVGGALLVGGGASMDGR